MDQTPTGPTTTTTELELATATFIPVVLCVPILCVYGGAVMAVLAGVCLLVGLSAGGIAVARF